MYRNNDIATTKDRREHERLQGKGNMDESAELPVDQISFILQRMLCRSMFTKQMVIETITVMEVIFFMEHISSQ